LRVLWASAGPSPAQFGGLFCRAKGTLQGPGASYRPSDGTFLFFTPGAPQRDRVDRGLFRRPRTAPHENDRLPAGALRHGLRTRAALAQREPRVLGQRDYRIFDNFTDETAIDNLIPDPDYPGATGAVLALHKGIQEWGSELHGSGVTDPFNPDGIGSGGANFDSYFLGFASVPGATNGNILSQLDGFGGGILAFTDIPIDDGWRIRFYQAPTQWHDGPGIPTTDQDNAWDLQGVTAHEYGHALGLLHSQDPEATMFASSNPDNSNKGVDFRSLSPDDIAGVQAIYGVKSPNKPRITRYELTPNGVALFGENFHPTDNEIWWTQTTITLPIEDDYLVTAGLPSTQGGTRIDAQLPATVAPGTVLVKVAGTTYDTLSNSWPFDPDRARCFAPLAFGQAKTNSNGGVPALTTTALPSAAFGRFLIHTQGGIPLQPVVLMSAADTGSMPFFGGTLYLSGALQREEIARFDSNGTATFVLPVDSGLVGTTRYYQLWFRDPGDALGVGVSDALEVTFCD